MAHFKAIRVNDPFHHARAHEKRQQTQHCGDQDFYTSPKSGDTIDSKQGILVTWDASQFFHDCVGEDKIKILLSGKGIGHVHEIKPISFADGKADLSLDPAWWGKASTVGLTVTIMGLTEPLFLGSLGTGPLFTVTYDGVSDNSTAAPDSIFNTKGGVAQNGSIPKGSIAAAVLVPIIVVFAAVFGYIKYARHRNLQKHKRFSQAVDARMSRISGDWQAMSAKGAAAAIRESRASGTAMRMSRVFAQEMRMDMRQSGERVSIAGRGSGDRQSRIAFAPEVNTSRERLSMYSQNRTSTYSNGRASRAFHVGITPPPVPRTPQTAMLYEGYEEDGSMSPRQAQGAIALSNDDIEPALRLMRTTNNPALRSQEDLLLTPTPTTGSFTSSTPATPHHPPLSPLGVMPMQGQNTTFMSPDDLLRQYAEARVQGARSPTLPHAVYSPGFPTSPSPSQPLFTATGMRNLTGDPSLGRTERF